MYRLPLATTAAALVLSACGQEPTTATLDGQTSLGPGAVATVNGEPVAESVFRLLSLTRLQKNADQLTAQEREALLEQLIRLELLTTEAEARGLPQERTIAAELELGRQQIIARAMVLRHLEENPPTEVELRDAYEANLARLSGTQYKARHILVESEPEAADVIDQLAAGADFSELAMSVSTGPSGSNGGDLGWFTADNMVQPFSAAVQEMEVGSFSSLPVQTRFGWHVILLEDRREEQAPGLDAVRAEMTNLVEQQKVEAFVDTLQQNAQITVP